MYVTSGKEFLLALHSARRPQVSFEGGANRRSLDLNLSYVDGLYLEPADPRAVFIYLGGGVLAVLTLSHIVEPPPPRYRSPTAEPPGPLPRLPDRLPDRLQGQR